MSEQTTTPQTELTVAELIGSMTGYDEDAIVQRFGKSFDDLDDSPFVRSLVFIDQRRREGVNDAQAYATAKAMSRGALNTYFTPKAEEALPDEPVSESGND